VPANATLNENTKLYFFFALPGGLGGACSVYSTKIRGSEPKDRAVSYKRMWLGKPALMRARQPYAIDGRAGL